MGGGRGQRSRGQGSQRDFNSPQAGLDIRVDLEISLEECFHGLETQITFPTAVSCKKCHGLGTKDGAPLVVCGKCGGRGVFYSQKGFFRLEQTCPECHGAGRIIKDKCFDCKGEGRISDKKTLSVKVPPGIDHGSQIRVPGQGEAGVRGGEPGNLRLYITVKPHALFRREGESLYCTVPISMVTAALGGTVSVPTIEGNPMDITVPEGIQTGHEFRIKSKGMPRLKSKHRGDMYIQTVIETPTGLSKKQKELLERFQKESQDNQPKTQSFFEKMKVFLDRFNKEEGFSDKKKKS